MSDKNSSNLTSVFSWIKDSQFLNHCFTKWKYYDKQLMPKTRIHGARVPRNARVKRPVCCGFVKRKKRGHEHIMIFFKNTKKQDVKKCKICKHHFFLFEKVILHIFYQKSDLRLKAKPTPSKQKFTHKISLSDHGFSFWEWHRFFCNV